MKELSNPVITGDVKIDNINLPDPLPEEGVIKQPWKMNIFASFISVGEYIERLENMPILMTIDRIKIMSAGDIYGHVNAELEGTAYGW
jgi:hypothetical protein